MTMKAVHAVAARIDRLDRALLRYAGLLAGLVCAAGLALRFWLASGPYLSPQEAWTCLMANSLDPATVWENSLRAHDSPLLILLLSAVRRFAGSEIAVRFVPVVFGGLTAAAMYLWLRRRASGVAAVFAAAAVSLSPAILALDSGVRAEPLLLFFMAASLYALDRVLEDGSVRWMGLFSLLLWLAMLSGFAAGVFATAAGIYYLIRLPGSPVNAWSRRIWTIGQLGAMALFWLLNGWRFEARDAGAEGAMPWLADLFPAAGEDPLLHLFGGTLKQFNFPFPSLPWAIFGMVLFAVALGSLIRRDERRSIGTAVLLSAPFLTVYVLSYLRLSPYGASRETAYLSLFVVAGAAMGADALCRGRILPALLLAALLAGVWHVPKYRDWWGVPHWRSDKDLMRETVSYLRAEAEAGALLVTDAETRLCLGYYLDPGGWTPAHAGLPNEERIAGLRVWAARWSFGGFDDLREDLEAIRSLSGELEGPVWVVDGGYENRLGGEADGGAAGRIGDRRDFGMAVTVWRLGERGGSYGGVAPTHQGTQTQHQRSE